MAPSVRRRVSKERKTRDHGYNKKGDEEIQFGSHEESLILRRQRKLLGAWSRGFGFVTFNEVVVRKVFDEIRERNVISWNSLLWGYVKCGDLAMALSVFDEMPEKDVVSWTSMVSGYARGKDMEPYELFRRIPESFK
ncbi:hypothetical protein SASPL_120078 [Salvia splendens]|uniref:Pentatricopeptide repeat-containing protein n=1 Tax=Salvia splendens TaxID=180675 RepID=A0A8X8ZV96_SALSN|nr:hypothetical protein SASPL_120078 [Salvia splendens]